MAVSYLFPLDKKKKDEVLHVQHSGDLLDAFIDVRQGLSTQIVGARIFCIFSLFSYFLLIF